MALTIRLSRPEDAPAVVAMVAALSAHEGGPRPAFTEADFRRDGFGPDAAFTTIVAELDGLPVGYASYHGAYDTEHGVRGSYLMDIYVADALRRRGVGRALVAAVAKETVAAGGRFVWWSMLQHNREAKGFYRALAKARRDLLVWSISGRHFADLAAG